MDVVVLRWPDEAERRERLSVEGRPRLLLVPSNVPAPVAADPLEDWIRLPAPDPDLQARVEALSRIAELDTRMGAGKVMGEDARMSTDSRPSESSNVGTAPKMSVDAGMRVAARPRVDEAGLLRYAHRWVSLPPLEARLAEALVERLGTVVSREVLTKAAWPGETAPGRNALDVHMARLRRRVGELDLAVTTVRSRGYVMDSATTW